MGDIDRAVDEAEQLLISAGRAKIRAASMDLRRKSVRSAMVVKHKGGGLSQGMAEHEAECDPTYELAKADWEAAATEAVTLEARAEAKKMRFEAWRTANATERAKMNLR